MIDLDRFNQTFQIVAPVRQNSFRYKGKRYTTSKTNDGWYTISITGNKCDIIGNNVTFQGTSITGYIYEDNLLFSNFDIGKRKVGQEVMTKIYFNTSPELSAVEAILWEDGCLYYKQPNYKEYKHLQVVNGQDINQVKGITPELRTLAFFIELRQQQLEELKKIKNQEELAKTIHGRLVLSLQRVGAELLDYSIRERYITINWSIGTQQFNSVLERDTFRVVEAGYCMSGHDKEHTLHSMAVLAQEYDKEDLIYKTRE